MKTAIFYASSTGNTERIAGKISKILGIDDVIDIASQGVDTMSEYDGLIIGSSTWGDGDLQDDWDSCFSSFKKIDFSNKTVAFFGLGDQDRYSDNFVDAMGILYKVALTNGARVVGSWSIVDYDFSSSVAVIGDEFVGLAIDEDNQDNLTNIRVQKWCDMIGKHFEG